MRASSPGAPLLSSGRSFGRAALALVLAAAVGLWSEPGAAQATRRDGADPAAARLQQQLRRLQADKSELQTQNADLTGQIEELKARLLGLEKTNQEHEASLARYEEAVGAYKQRLEESFERIRQTDAQLLDLAGVQQETSAALQHSRAQGERLTGELEDRTRQLGDCEDKNAKLYEANVEMAERFERKGLWDALLQAEPFTGIKQVEVENLLEEYRYRIEDLRRAGAQGTDARSGTGLPAE
jgi:chromosome segregation ATPase